ncbi:MAG: PP2C family serine/threonine-protein phosphatase [Acetobacteraceae bacterium]
MNEDSWFSCSDRRVWVIADGAGGHGNGTAASRAVIAAIESLPLELNAAEVLAQIRLRLGAVHASLLAKGRETAGGVTASTVVVLILRGRHFACLWAGDSRAYRLTGDTLEQLTRDHSLVQSLIDDGTLSVAEADGHPDANVITRAVGGGHEPLELDKVTGTLVERDRFLLCSDGVCKALSPLALRQLMRDGADAGQIVSAALAHVVRDNATAVTVDVGG